MEPLLNELLHPVLHAAGRNGREFSLREIHNLSHLEEFREKFASQLRQR